MSYPHEICPPELCTGCGACQNICPHNAILMEKGALGHIFPCINTTNCTNCNLCKTVCPVLHQVVLVQPKSTYAAWAIDDEEHRTSSSGGIAAILAKHIVSLGGVVYGAVLDQHKIFHKRIDNKEELGKLKGSKYVHSHTELAYRQVKEDLLAQRIVLYIGLPCQIAGLKNYLKRDYDKLYTVDMICHGIPSQGFFFEYLEKQCKILQNTITDIKFRDESGFNLKVSFNDNSIYCKSCFEDLYYMGFIEKIFYRTSCFSCSYAQSRRCGDLTIGDFWGLGVKTPFNLPVKNGISVLLVNTTKGEHIFHNIQSYTCCVERELSEAVAGNTNLRHASSCPRNYYRFVRDYSHMEFCRALKRNLRIRRLKSLILRLYLPVIKILKNKL